MLFGAGCHTAPKSKPPAIPRKPEEQILGKITPRYYRPFPELKDLWHAMVEGFQETGYLHVFEKGDVRVAVCMQPWGGVGVNALVIYTYDGGTKQWTWRALWGTESRGSNEVIGVSVNFYKRTGMIEAYSGGGRFIFRTDIASLAAGQPEDVFPGEQDVEYPALRTLEELRVLAEHDGEGGRLHVFEKGRVKVGVRVQPLGAARWKRLILYTFDEIGNQWSPRAIWDTGARDARVAFNKWSAMIKVHSGDGRLILHANILALEARLVPWGW